MTEAPATDEQLRAARRDSLGVLLARIERGLPVTHAEAQQLRRYVEAEIRDADTSRAVARGNLRHVREIVPDLERAEAVIERARTLASRWAVMRTHGSAATELRAALADPKE